MGRSWTVATLVATTLAATILSEADNVVAAKTSIPKECPKTNPSHKAVHLPHEWDCTKFYTCDHGKKVLFECPVMDAEGNRLYYNPELEVCDWPEHSGCVQGTQPTTVARSTEGKSLATTQSTTQRSPTWAEIVTTTKSSPTSTEATTTSTTTQRPSTTSSPTTIQTSTQPTTTPTTIAETRRPTTESTSTTMRTSTETTNAPTTIETTWPSTTPELPSTTTSKATTIETTENTTPVPTYDVEKPSTPTPTAIYIPHESNCSLYYKVINNTKILEECPPGLHFSPIALTCMSPADAGCESTTVSPEVTTPTNPTCGIPCDGVSHGSLVSHECLCDKYYRCSNGDLILHRCPKGLHFNPKIYSCDYPSSAGCIATTPKPSTDKPTTSMTIPSQCPPENSGGTVQFPHPTNCSLFYKCDNGEKKLMQCPNGLHFNPTIQMCDWPNSAGCMATTNPVYSSEATTEPTAIDLETSTKAHSISTSTVSTTTKIIHTECPKEDSGLVVQLPHPYNCSLYYKCHNGEKILQSCPAGLEFNPREQVCDWPDVAGCHVSTTEAPLTTTKLTTESIKASTETTILPNTTIRVSTTIGILTECPANDSGRAVHLPHPYNCSLYYNCENGKKIVQLCPPGLEFNPREQVCDWPDVAGCHVSTTETPLTTTKLTTDSIKASTATTKLLDETTTKEMTTPSTNVDSPTAHPESTESSSASSTTITETRPPKTTMELMTSTVDSTNPGITDSSSECPPDSNGLQLPHESNCSLYYECNDGKKVLMECTPGLHFSPALELCVWPSNAGCEATTVSTDSSPSLITEDNGDQESWPSPTTIYSSTPNSFETEYPDEINCIGTCPAKDPSDRTILLPHKDCTKFCKCSNSRPFVYRCPADLHFSPTLLVCDYPKKAKCLGEGGFGRPEEISSEQYV